MQKVLFELLLGVARARVLLLTVGVFETGKRQGGQRKKCAALSAGMLPASTSRHGAGCASRRLRPACSWLTPFLLGNRVARCQWPTMAA